VPSNLYSFSFALKPDWSRSYPEQPEVLDYLRECSHRFGVRDRIHFECEMREAAWRESEQRWEVETPPRAAERADARLRNGPPE
jgi:cation diffusion facilitator CzcD-associated flavoprotein CzcO